ncbi:unnamed protein product [Pedinophyceae sp. YPF-701]|nr:unnamed protein product [Pedinophyceae sp. YPF-701]
MIGQLRGTCPPSGRLRNATELRTAPTPRLPAPRRALAAVRAAADEGPQDEASRPRPRRTSILRRSAPRAPRKEARVAPSKPAGRPVARDSSEAEPSGRDVAVTFELRHPTEWGQCVRVIGSVASLGSWELSKAATMTWTEGHVWKAAIKMPVGSVAEYKYVVTDPSGKQPFYWQQGNNSVLALNFNDKEVTVKDNWAAAPGASLVSGNEQTTRENRLAAWANEMHTTIAAQRRDLRQARMELVQVKEEARRAKDLEADLNRERTHRRELETVNKQLLQDNAELQAEVSMARSEFQEALRIAQDILVEDEDELEAAEVEEAAEEPASRPGVIQDVQVKTSDIYDTIGRDGGFIWASTDEDTDVVAAEDDGQDITAQTAPPPTSGGVLAAEEAKATEKPAEESGGRRRAADMWWSRSVSARTRSQDA